LHERDLIVAVLAAEAGFVTPSTWELRPVPSPDEAPAAESLARILQRTGLAFRGVEVVAAP